MSEFANYTDHELMKLIRKRVNQKPSIPMTQIAAELGCEVDLLCAFVMMYREQKPARDPHKNAPAIATNNSPGPGSYGALGETYRRRRNWERAKEGARLALKNFSAPVVSIPAAVTSTDTSRKPNARVRA